MRIALMNACRAADPRPTRVRRPSRIPRASPHTPQPLPLQDVADSIIIFNHRVLFTLPKNALTSTYITVLIQHDVFYCLRCILFLFLSLKIIGIPSICPQITHQLIIVVSITASHRISTVYKKFRRLCFKSTCKYCSV